jgi:ParB family transcriptional regulator, chromosome partitioning protein
MKHKTATSITATSETAETIIVNVPHDQLVLSPLNPRKHKRDKDTLLELANSILEQGVLHNLTARKKGKKYEVVIGEGRYLAVKYLIDKRRLAKDYPMPVSVKELSDLDVVELATAENIHRSDMHPLDEAIAFAEMMQQGRDVESIAIKMGVSTRTVEQRLAIATQLNFEVKQALSKDELTLAQAQQLTNASFETQDFILEQLMQGYIWTPDRIKSYLSDQLMPVKHALFPLELYKGEITNNLFDDEHEQCFVDTEQAKRLQLEGIEEKRKSYAETWAWVEVGYSKDINPWQYEKAQTPDPKEHGVILRILGETMQVEIYDGVIKRQAKNNKTSSGTKDKTHTPPPYTKRLLMECKHLKTQALQTALSANHRHCLILNIMGLMGCSEVKIKTDIPFLGKDFKTEALEQIFEPHIKALTKKLSEGAVKAYPLEVKTYGNDQAKLYTYLRKLSDEDLQTLFNVLTASTFGSWYGVDPQPGDKALPLQVAKDLEIDMAQHFTPSEAFFKGYRKPGLIKLLRELGFHQDFSSMTSKALIEFIMSVIKDKNYLPKLVQFFGETVQAINETSEDDATLKQAA